MSDLTLRKTIFLKASKDRVWDYLTQPDKLKTWFHTPKMPLTEGPLEMFGRDSGDRLIWGTVTVFEPPERLAYTFTIAAMDGAESLVAWHLTEVAGGTRLSLEHSGLPEGTEAFELTFALDKGWDGHFMELRDALAD